MSAVGSEGSPAETQTAFYRAGVAKVDVTPYYPIRLNGFGGRREESAGVAQRIWAKALAIQAGDAPPLVLLAVDSLGFRESHVDEVARRLQDLGLPRERLAATFTHSHTTPKVNGACDTIFSSPIPLEHQAHIDRYTDELVAAMERAAREAIADLRPARLERAVGQVGFAQNRRTPGGPVDHDLPLLVVRNAEDDQIRAVYVTYACHCVTLSFNQISGDWAGFAQEALERALPGTVALVSIGCGSDANPDSGVTVDNLAAAADQGSQIADEALRLLKLPLRPVTGPLSAQLGHVALPLRDPPDRETLEQVAARGGPDGYNAQYHLERLQRGETLPTELRYPVQTWTFGESLEMVFLAGEVCVDYALRLKRELDPDRLWLHGYANDFCAYIPSERLLREGGYGGGAEVVYFALPNTLAPGLEDKIIAEAVRQSPESYRQAGAQRATAKEALAPAESTAALQTRPELVVELVASEPHIADPVAIDFGPDGRVWVADMTDYSRGVDEEFTPTGTIRVLGDPDGDGTYDQSVVFAEGLRFPTDVKVWRQGVIVCDAPDVLYLADADGDGRADQRQVLITGFATHNAQARVNSLRWGLDNWLYGACGLFGGELKTFSGAELQLGGRDFRFDPTTGAIEPATGRTQQGRDRDDWGNWFGCDNGTLMKHFPLVDQYLARNPYLVPPATEAFVPTGNDPGQLFPIGEATLFELSGPPGRPTSACGLGVYRDELLGPEYSGNLFVAESVNRLVHRRQLAAAGGTFRGARAAGEETSEFLASRDAWFRPVQIRTGLDGCLWIVDMHRSVIEHKIWIPAEQLAQVDVWAGREAGRIYRVRPRDVAPRRSLRLDQLDGVELAAALDSPNGPQRDLVHQLLLERQAVAAIPRLRELALEASRPAVRVQALCALDGLDGLDAATLQCALADADPRVQRHAVRLSEPRLAAWPEGLAAVCSLADAQDGQLLMQTAYSLGATSEEQAALALARIAWTHRDDPYLAAAALSSVGSSHLSRFCRAVVEQAEQAELPEILFQPLLKQAIAAENSGALAGLLTSFSRSDVETLAAWQWSAAVELLSALRRATPQLRDDPALQPQLAALDAIARRAALDAPADEQSQAAAVQLLSLTGSADEALPVLAELLMPQRPPAVQLAVLSALRSVEDDQAATIVLDAWAGLTGPARSEAFDLLLGRTTLTRRLLEALGQGQVSPADLDAMQRQRLLTLEDDALAAEAASALAGAVDANRAQIVADYLAADVEDGVAARGRGLFEKHCASCHELQGVGYAVGPDLAAITNRSRPAWTEAILDPNRAVDERYRTYTALTSEGLARAGILRGETSTSVTLVEQRAAVYTLLRSDLELFENSGRSLMPEGLEQDISPQDVVDLIAYVNQQRRTPKEIPGNQPLLVAPDYDGTLWLRAADAEIYGQQITFETPHQNIGYWHGVEDHVVWNLETNAFAEYEAYVHWACPESSARNGAVLEAGGRTYEWNVGVTDGYDDYRVQPLGRIPLPAGRQQIVLRPRTSLHGENLMDLRGVYLVPTGASTTRAAAGQALAPTEDAARSVARLTRGLAVGTPAEYAQIPAIWEAAVAAGERNLDDELLRLLDASLPPAGERLHDWQTVVLGGGVVGGLSRAQVEPAGRLSELLRDDAQLAARWEAAVAQAGAIADDPAVAHGTRYDALRLLGAAAWDGAQPKLAAYLGPEAHAELQMGAVSALGDVAEPEAAEMLAGALAHLAGHNRQLALDALCRGPHRIAALRKALAAGTVRPDELTDAQRAGLAGDATAP